MIQNIKFRGCSPTSTPWIWALLFKMGVEFGLNEKKGIKKKEKGMSEKTVNMELKWDLRFICDLDLEIAAL